MAQQTLNIERAMEGQSVERERLLQDGDFLRDSAYILLDMEHPSYRNISGMLNQHLDDRISGTNNEDWAAVASTYSEAHNTIYDKWKAEQFDAQHQNFLEHGYLDGETESPDQLVCVRCDNYPPVVVDGRACLMTAFLGSKGEFQRTSLHVSFNHTVAPIAAMGGGASWTESNIVYLFPYTEAKGLNGAMYGFKPEDGWWALGTEPFVLPEGTIAITQAGSSTAEELKAVPGVSILEVEGKPYFQAEKIMQQYGLPVKGPKDFRNARKFADQEGVFYGYHLGGGSGQGSESYIWAEGIIDRNNRLLESAEQIAEDFNSFNNEFPEWSGFSRWILLMDLVGKVPEYFDPKDYCPDYDEERDQFDFLEVVKTLNGHYHRAKGASINELVNGADPERARMAVLADKFVTQLQQRAEDPNFALDPFSENLMKSVLNDIKQHLDIIPPQLLGTFIMGNKGRFQLAQPQ